ncbi:MAG: tryptophan 7-halogenase [Verrucomicrobiaceae bacterium]|nr:MAG: tryptophan 7-halogenase [Verrucomicrobiaceae bacterium]
MVMNISRKIEKVVVLGGGSAGLIAALTVKKMLPELKVEVVHSVELGVIGVGEGTTAAFPRHFFEYLKMDPLGFYLGAEPVWKMGIRFDWGPQPQGFYYSFQHEYKSRWPEMSRNTGFYCTEQTRWLGITSACMAHNKVFPRKPDGSPHFHKGHAFHIENIKLIGWLTTECRQAGVEFTEGKVSRVERGAEGVEFLELEDGRGIVGDLFVDASGFRSELLGRTMGEEYISFEKSLFCDRAVIAGWPRTTEPVQPYTVAETMDAGWCWRIDHEHWINRGYVYSSRFISDEDALAEFRRKNPKIANEPRVVRFKSGRYKRQWVGNVVGIGNAVGFVEPLEATALQVICVESSTLADTLKDSLCEPTPSLIDLYNRYNSRQWDDIRDFLSIHYAFNRRLDTPFWRACQEETDIAGAAEIVRFYQENGPSLVADAVLFDPTNSFGLEGYLALLVGQGVPHGKPWSPPPAEAKVWRDRLAAYGQHGARAYSAEECLSLIRAGKIKFS